MGKAVGKIALGAAIIGASFIPGIGPAISTALFSLGAGTALSGATTLAGLGPKAPANTLAAMDRLNASMVPSTSRKMLYGTTAMATDIRYIEPSGENQEYIDYIIVVAAHRVTSIDRMIFEDQAAWTSAGGVTSKYVGYLWIQTRLEGTAANAITINGGTRWGPSRRLTGCAYVHIRIKRTGNGKKAESPLAGGLPSRLTIIGAGMPLYDPRFDSTVAGGNGPQRANDQSTWAYSYGGRDQGPNLALQILAQLLGWRISGKVSGGYGLPSARIDLASFAVAANLCDEGVTRVDGSVVPRYTGAGIASEADEPQGVLSALCTACNGRLRDGGGKLSLAIMHNDLAIAAADDGLGDDDVLSKFIWSPDEALEQSYNIVRGRYCDPSDNSLYQLVDYPEVSLPAVDGIDRVLTLDLPWIDDAARAQRIAKQVLQRRQYPGSFSAVFGAEAWRYQVGEVLPLTFSPLGFDRKLFRVAEQTLGERDGTCQMLLTVEHPSIYAWDKDERAAVQAAEPIRYDPLNNPIILGIEQASETALWSGVIDDNGELPEPNATNSADPNSPLGPTKTVGQALAELAQARADVDTALAASGGTQAGQAAVLAAQAARDSAQGYAEIAQDNATAAANYSELSTRGPALTRNPTFSRWDDGQALPAEWTLWQLAAGGAITRVPGVNGRPYAVRMASPQGTTLGLLQQHIAGFGSYVVEVTIRADNVKGAGVLLQFIKEDGTEVPGASVYHALLNKADSSGWPGHPDGGSDSYLRTFSWFHQTPIDGNIARCNVYALANSSTAAGESASKNIEWHEARLRPAAEAEIAQHSPIDGLGTKASITYADQVAADAQGNAIATSRADYTAKSAERTAQVSDAIVAAAGPAGVVGQRISEVIASSGGNIVPNSALITFDGYFTGGLYGANPGTGFGMNIAGDTWRFPGENNLSMSQTGGVNTEYMEWFSDIIGTDSGKSWQLSVYSASHRADTQVFIQRYDTANNPVDYVGGPRIARGGGANGGQSPSGWDHDANTVNFQALGPVRILLRKYGTNLGLADSYAWFSRPQIARVASLTSPTLPYSPSANQAAARTTQAALNDLRGKLKAYVEFEAEAGGSAARVSLVAVDDNGNRYSTIILDAENTFVNGNLIVAGTVTIDGLDRSTMTATTSGSVGGSWGGAGTGGPHYIANLGADMAIRSGGSVFITFDGYATGTNQDTTGSYASIELLNAANDTVLASLRLPQGSGNNGRLDNYTIRVLNTWGNITLRWRVATRAFGAGFSIVSNPAISVYWTAL